MDTAQAFAHCRRLARTHYENFTVGSWLLPRDRRPHIFNLYAYARTVDDLGDEAPGDRLALLHEWQQDLLGCYEGRRPRHPVLLAVRETIRAFQIPPEPFLKLIQANRMDQHFRRFPTFDDLLHYCDHSANPCGRLFLYVFDVRDPELHSIADATCTALQLTNFWQDIAVDYAKGRIYLPQEDLAAHGVSESDIADGLVTDGFARLLRFEIERTRDFFRRGAVLADRLHGPVRFDVRLFTRAGLKVLEKIEQAGFDVFRHRPGLTRLEKASLMVGALVGR